MGSKKSFVKGLAAGAVLGAVAAMLHSMTDKDKKMHDLEKAAMRIKDKVASHAKKLGKLSKAAYEKKELKSSWGDVKTMIDKKKK